MSICYKTNLSFALYRDEACSNKIEMDSSGYVDLKAGIYYVKVTGTYQLSGNFSKAVSYDSKPNDTMQTAIPLTSGKLVKGNANIAFGELYNQDDAPGYKVTASKAATPQLPALKNGKVANVSGKAIQVSWSVNGSANGYYIYRKSNDASYKLIKTITSGFTLKLTGKLSAVTGVKVKKNKTYTLSAGAKTVLQPVIKYTFEHYFISLKTEKDFS